MKTKVFLAIASVCVLVAGALIISGCTDSIPVPTSTSPSNTGPAKVGAVAFLMKDNMPFIMVNMAPELPKFEKSGKQAKENYLLRRAAEILLDFAVDREQYEGTGSFVVRMVLLEGKDDYNRPKWGSAADLAYLELPRAKLTGITKDSLPAMETEQLKGLFSSVQFK